MHGLLFATLLVVTWLFKDEVNRFEVVLNLVFVVLVAGASYAFFVFRRQVDNSRTSGNGSVRLNWGLIRTGAIASLCTLLAAASLTATVHTYLPFMKLCLGEEESARIVTMLSVANETWYVIEGNTLVSYLQKR